MVKAPASRRRGAMHCSTRCVATKRRWAARTSVRWPLTVAMAPKSPWGKARKFPASHVWPWGYLQGMNLVKNCLVKPRPKNIGFWEYTWHVTIQKHRILRIHMTCYYGHLWAIVFTLVVMCVCVFLYVHTHTWDKRIYRAIVVSKRHQDIQRRFWSKALLAVEFIVEAQLRNETRCLMVKLLKNHSIFHRSACEKSHCT